MYHLWYDFCLHDRRYYPSLPSTTQLGSPGSLCTHSGTWQEKYAWDVRCHRSKFNLKKLCVTSPLMVPEKVLHSSQVCLLEKSRAEELAWWHSVKSMEEKENEKKFGTSPSSSSPSTRLILLWVCGHTSTQPPCWWWCPCHLSPCANQRHTSCRGSFKEKLGHPQITTWQNFKVWL